MGGDRHVLCPDANDLHRLQPPWRRNLFSCLGVGLAGATVSDSWPLDYPPCFLVGERNLETARIAGAPAAGSCFCKEQLSDRKVDYRPGNCGPRSFSYRCPPDFFLKVAAIVARASIGSWILSRRPGLFFVLTNCP